MVGLRKFTKNSVRTVGVPVGIGTLLNANHTLSLGHLLGRCSLIDQKLVGPPAADGGVLRVVPWRKRLHV